MTTTESALKIWATRRKRYGATGIKPTEFADPIYIEHLMRRWIYDHDIRAMGELAVRETA